MMIYTDAIKDIAVFVEQSRRLGILNDGDTEAEIRGRVVATARIFGLDPRTVEEQAKRSVAALEPLGKWVNHDTKETCKVSPCMGGYKLEYTKDTHGCTRRPELSSKPPRDLMKRLVMDGFDQRR